MRSFCKLTCFLFITITFIVGSGCKKYVRNGDMDGGVVLTFDDNYIDDWYRFLPILDSFGAKATFYVSHYTMLTPLQKQKLKEIQQHGHEIGFHTTHHANLVNMLKNKTLQQVMQVEVRQALDSMRKDGIYPKNFAYPFGQHNEVLDAAMLSIFRSIRLLNGTQDYSKSVCTTKHKTCLRSLNIDESGISSDVISRMLESAKEHSNAVVFLAHKINTPPQLYISKNRLIYVLTRAKQLGLKFYKVEDLTR
jgi:hypothetical protein